MRDRKLGVTVRRNVGSAGEGGSTKKCGGHLWRFAALLPAIALLISCGATQKALQSVVKKPEVQVEGVRLNRLTFHDLELGVVLGITNPNPVTIPMTGFRYALEVAGERILSGENAETSELAANSSTTITLPLRIVFDELRRVSGALVDQDSAEYTIRAAFRFSLPVLGEQEVPLNYSSRFPVIRTPSVRLKGIKIHNLSFTSAQIGLLFSVANPNPISFALPKLEYALEVRGNRWLSGVADRLGRIPARGDATVEIPASLDFLQLGRAAYSVIEARGKVPYRIAGQLLLETSLPFFETAPISFDVSGETDILR